MLVLVVGGAFTTDLFLLILLYQYDCTKHYFNTYEKVLDSLNGTIKAHIVRNYRELCKHASSLYISKPEVSPVVHFNPFLTDVVAQEFNGGSVEDTFLGLHKQRELS